MKVVQQNLPESNRNIRSVYELERDAMKRGVIKPFSGNRPQNGGRDKSPLKKENMDLKGLLNKPDLNSDIHTSLSNDLERDQN